MQVTNPAYSSGTRLYNRALCDSHRNPLNRFARDFQESLPKYREQIAQYARYFMLINVIMRALYRVCAVSENITFVSTAHLFLFPVK